MPISTNIHFFQALYEFGSAQPICQIVCTGTSKDSALLLKDKKATLSINVDNRVLLFFHKRASKKTISLQASTTRPILKCTFLLLTRA